MNPPHCRSHPPLALTQLPRHKLQQDVLALPAVPRSRPAQELSHCVTRVTPDAAATPPAQKFSGPPANSIFPQRAHVAVRLRREQRAPQIAHRMHLIVQFQPAEIVLRKPASIPASARPARATRRQCALQCRPCLDHENDSNVAPLTSLSVGVYPLGGPEKMMSMRNSLEAEDSWKLRLSKPAPQIPKALEHLRRQPFIPAPISQLPTPNPDLMPKPHLTAFSPLGHPRHVLILRTLILDRPWPPDRQPHSTDHRRSVKWELPLCSDPALHRLERPKAGSPPNGNRRQRSQARYKLHRSPPGGQEAMPCEESKWKQMTGAMPA